MRKVVLLAAALVVALGVAASSATSASTETGITARTIKIGGTFPLTGPASLYATILRRDEGVLLVHQLAEGRRTASAASTAARSSTTSTTTATTPPTPSS